MDTPYNMPFLYKKHWGCYGEGEGNDKNRVFRRIKNGFSK